MRRRPRNGEGRSLLAASRRRRPFRAHERAHLRTDRSPALGAGALRPLPLRARGSRARGQIRDRDDADQIERRPSARRRRRRECRLSRYGPIHTLPLRGTALARRRHPRRSRSCRQPAMPEHRSRPRQATARARAAGTYASWGRDELQTGDMWNSNSLISWLIARSGLDPGTARLPAGGRAPGWHAGLVVAARERRSATGEVLMRAARRRRSASRRGKSRSASASR